MNPSPDPLRDQQLNEDADYRWEQDRREQRAECRDRGDGWRWDEDCGECVEDEDDDVSELAKGEK